MKFELEVAKFDVADIITTSACTDMRPSNIGGDIVVSCSTDI